MFDEEPARLAAGKLGDPVEHVDSLRGFECGVIDATDQRRQLLFVFHGYSRSNGERTTAQTEMTASFRRADFPSLRISKLPFLFS